MIKIKPLLCVLLLAALAVALLQALPLLLALPTTGNNSAQIILARGDLSQLMLVLGLLCLTALITAALSVYKSKQLYRRLSQRDFEQKQLLRLLGKSERHLQAVLDGTYDAIISIDRHSTIESFNSGAEKLFGYRREDVMGKNMSMLLPNDERQYHNRYVKNASLNGPKDINGARQLYARHKSGQLVPVEVTLNRIYERGEQKYIGVVRDITELANERNNLSNALSEAKKANEAKTRLLSSASHELRTPLNAIMGFSELLMAENDNLSAQQRMAQLQDIYRSAELLLLLVNDVLDYAKLESGQAAINKVPVHLKSVITDCMRMSGEHIKSKHIQYGIDCSDSLFVNADSLRLQQVLLNLISNACKYNHEAGSIIISCAQQGDDIVIDIKDSGIGVEENKRSQLFTPFARLHDLAMDIEGSGIGLSISKSLMEFMRGDLTYRPSLQGGSIFSLRLPKASAPALEKGAAQQHQLPTVGTSYQVLYVEDNAVNVRLMEAVLARLGVTMVAVGSGEKALDYLAEQQPDCIFMDINLPGISGDETASRIRQQYPDLKAPLVAVSAAIDHHYQDESLFVGRIAKPFKIAEVKKVLQGIQHKAVVAVAEGM